MKSIARRQVQAQLMRLDLLRDLLGEMYSESIPRQALSARPAILFSSILKVRQAAHAVQLLADGLCVAEIAAIATTISEVVINAAYLQFAGDEELNRFLQPIGASNARHAEQLLVKSPRRTSGDVMHRIIQSAVSAVFKGVAVENDLRWSAKTIYQRAEFADRASEVPIMNLLVKTLHARVYAAQHEQFDSLAPFVGASDTLFALETDERHHQLAEALFGVNLGLMTLSLYLNSYLQLGMEEAIETTLNPTDHPMRRERLYP